MEGNSDERPEAIVGIGSCGRAVELWGADQCFGDAERRICCSHSFCFKRAEEEMSVWTVKRNHPYIFRPPILSFFQPDQYPGQALGLPQDRKSTEVPVDACRGR